MLNTSFDYALRSTWDLKAHSTTGENAAILNDLDAIEAGLAEPGGLGFIVLTGDPDLPTRAAIQRLAPRAARSSLAHDRSRALTSGFVPKRLDAYRGELSQMAQGRQPDGAPRKPKLKVNFGAAHSAGGSRVASRPLTP